jgi:hypothetical protein
MEEVDEVVRYRHRVNGNTSLNNVQLFELMSRMCDRPPRYEDVLENPPEYDDPRSPRFSCPRSQRSVCQWRQKIREYERSHSLTNYSHFFTNYQRCTCSRVFKNVYFCLNFCFMHQINSDRSYCGAHTTTQIRQSPKNAK